MKRNTSALAAAIAATLGTAGAADAATLLVTLNSVTTYSNSGSSALNLTSSTATWSYDDVTGVLTQTAGVFNARATTAPISTLFRHTITGLVIGAGAAATATDFTCTEGNFGGNVSASICGNYVFGSNGLNESSTTWGPGTAAARTIGADDASIGAQQTLNSQYDTFTTTSFNGTTLVLENARCTTGAGNCTGTGHVNGFNAGYTWTLTVTAPNAVADAASTTRNVAVDIDVLANDQDLVDPVTVTIASQGTNGGTAVVNGSPGNQADIDITFTPNWPAGQATGTETFEYSVAGDTATVTVTVNNAVPDAVGGALSAISTVGFAPAGRTGTFTAPGAGGSLGNAGTVSITAQGTKGTATVVGNAITYTVTDAGFFTGGDQFTYQIVDTDGETDTANVTVTIADASPVLADSSVTTTEDTDVDVDLLALTTPGNGSTAQHNFFVDVDAEFGDCDISGTTLTYTPDPDYAGTDSCEVGVEDGDEDDDYADIDFTVNAAVTATGLREDDGGSSADLLILALLGSGALIRRRRKA